MASDNGWDRWGKYVIEALKQIISKQADTDKSLEHIRLVVERLATREEVDANATRIIELEARIALLEQALDHQVDVSARREVDIRRDMDVNQGQNVTWQYLWDKYSTPIIVAIALIIIEFVIPALSVP